MKYEQSFKNFSKAIRIMRIGLSLFALLCSSLCVWSQKYSNPVKNEFPIVAWYALDSEHNTKKDYQMMSEAGFNLSLSFFSSYKDVLQGLQECEGTGVKLITYCWELRRKAEEFIPMVKDNKNLAFYFTDDEPSRADFEDLKRRIELRKKIDNTHPCYVNLQPNYASPEQLKSANYEEYIASYLKVINPSMISFDNYPFRLSGFRDGYYENLSYISNISREYSIPFWGFVMSATDKQYPVTNEAYLRFQAAMDLAFGCKRYTIFYLLYA